jgi:hypothetical protein
MAAIIFANGAVLDGTRNERRESHHVVVEGDPLKDISLFDGPGELLSVILKDGILYKCVR